MRFRFGWVGLLGLLVLLVVGFVVLAQSGGLEYNIVQITVPVDLVGSVQVYIVPLNVSDFGLLREDNVYVLMSGSPRVSYLFSRIPPVVAFVEPSAYTASYEIWYGGGNPYVKFIGAPGSQESFWLAFDEFDYNTGFWANVSVTIHGSRVYIEPGGSLTLLHPYSPKTVHMWVLHGRRALVILLPQSFNKYILVYLTRDNFTDIALVRDGSDVYFVDGSGGCLYHEVLVFDRTAGKLYVAVNPVGNTVIYMLYGGENPCTAYRSVEQE